MLVSKVVNDVYSNITCNFGRVSIPLWDLPVLAYAHRLSGDGLQSMLMEGPAAVVCCGVATMSRSSVGRDQRGVETIPSDAVELSATTSAALRW